MRPRALLGLGLLLALLGGGAVWVTVIQPIRELSRTKGCNDFDGFFYGAECVLAGESFYDYVALQRRVKRDGRRPSQLASNTAPVFATVPFMALLPLPYPAARLVWQLGTLVALAVAFAAIRTGLVRAWREPWPPWRDRALGVLALTLVATHAAVAHHFCHGQTNLHMLMLLALAAALLVSPRPTPRTDAWIGLCLALAVLSKLYPAIVLPILALAGRWRALAWTAAFALLLVAVTLPLTGIDDYLRYPAHFSGTYYMGGGVALSHNLSFKHALHRAFGGGVGAGANAATLAAALPVAWVYARLWLERRRPQAIARPELHLLARWWQVLLLVGCIMASTWEYHMVLGFGALALLVAWQRPSWPVRWPTACVAASLLFAALPVSLLTPLGAHAPARQLALILPALGLEAVIRSLVRERPAPPP